MISSLYAAFARRRRERYSARPDLRKRLRHPVISVGNLAVGGRGKTPIAAYVTRLLLEMGEHPAVLSRGYARQEPDDGVVIVRDPDDIHADLPRAGDEPLMLARQLPGASVLVCEDRYLAGRLAEQHLGATVHVLDDGLQHMQLDRDVEIVLVGPEDVARPETLPAGRLREPLDVLIVADAILAPAEVMLDVQGADTPVFRTRRHLGEPVADDDRIPPGPVLAIAGIARPESFFEGLRARGYQVAGTLSFSDHYSYARRDLQRIAETARAANVTAVLTTEKDYVRLLPLRPFSLPVGFVPLTMEPEPIDEFRAWLAAGLNAARDGAPLASNVANPGD
jgi:tetraacyldisaccharide 4'-kinase